METEFRDESCDDCMRPLGGYMTMNSKLEAENG